MAEEKITNNMVRQIRYATKINKWLVANGSDLVWDPQLSRKYYGKRRGKPMVNFGNMKIQADLKADLQKWADKEVITVARYVRNVLNKWARIKKQKEKMLEKKNVDAR